jgi:amino acid transporter
LLYILVVIVALLTVGAEALAGQRAPLSFLFSETTGLPPLAISLIAVVATLNGVIVQIIMISRLSYGLSSRRLLPEFLSRVNPRTRTPLYATALATAAILGLALSLPIVTLAEWTSRIILLIFAIVCLSLLRLKLRGEPAPEGAFQTPTWVPGTGVFACMALLALDFLFG